MPFCPNLSNPIVKKEFDILTKKHGENLAYYLWDKYQGVVPTDLVQDREKQIESYFKDRFGTSSVFIKNSLESVAGAEVFAYVQEGAAHIARWAPADTAYHEAFHLFFRTTLNEAQREQLYKDGLKRYGEPTAEDMQKAARGQVGLTDAELRLLALEERMAEEFRFYSMSEVAPKGLGKRIAKFFKDLWAYIKAIVGKPLTIRQAFRLLESNKIPAKFTRNITQFGDSTAFMIKDFATDYALHQELTRIGASMVVDSYDAMLAEIDPSDKKAFAAAARRKAVTLLGNRKTQGPSEVRDAFLRLSVSYVGEENDEGGRQLSYTDFMEYKALYDAWKKSGDSRDVVAFMDDKKIYADPPHKDVRGVEISKMFVYMDEEDPGADFSRMFGAIYDNWYDKTLENGRVQRGFRSDIVSILPEFGFSLNEKETKITDDLGEVERIYSMTRLEEDPGETLTQKVRILLSRIPIDDTSRTRTGIMTYAPAMEVYKAVLDTVADSASFGEMLNKLEARGKTIPMFKAVHEKINNLADHEQAALYYALNLSSHRFMRIEAKQEGKGKKKAVSTRIYSPNTGSVIKQKELEWRSDSTSYGGLFKKLREEDGGGYLIDAKKKALALELADKVGIDLKKGKLTSKSLDATQQADLARLMMTLGVKIAPTEKEAIDRVQAVFKITGGSNAFLRSRFFKIVKTIVSAKESIGTSFFEDEGSTIKTIIETFVAPFETAKSQAFTNSLNKSIYPINKKARLNNEEKRIRNGELIEFLRNTLHHDVGGRTSILFKFLNNKKYVKDFEFLTVEAFGKDTEEDTFNYVPEEMTPEQLRATRYNAWHNGGRNLGFGAIDTQGDRKRYTLMPFPKLDIVEVREEYGAVDYDSWLAGAIVDELMLDLNRMQAAREDISAAIKNKSLDNLIEGYHYRINKGKVDFNRAGWNKFNIMNSSVEVDPETGIPTSSAIAGLFIGAKVAIENQDSLVDDADIAAFTALREQAVEEIRKNYLDEARAIGAEVTEDGKINVDEKSAAYAFLRDNVDGKAIGNPAEFIKQYATADYLNRIASRSLFRSGVNFTKNGEDYVKRAQLITTPGGQGVLKGDLKSNPNYGLSRTFNASTVRDIMVALPEEQLEDFKNRLTEKVGETAALNIVNAYRRITSTDAQAFISPKHYYELMQFRGIVDETFEEVYQNYLETGIWDPSVPVIAQKPSYDGMIKKQTGEFTMTVPYSDKTSYITLTRELVNGIPVLEDLLNRMEAVGVYEGMETIEVVHTESAQKLAIVPPHTVRLDGVEQFGEMVVQEMDSQFLRFPEEVPLKSGKATVALGHQVKVNMLTNIYPNRRYVYNDGLDTAQETTGEEMQTLFHETLSEKIRRSLIDLHKEIGYDAVLNAKDAAEREVAIKKFIPKLRAKFGEMGMEKTYNEAQLNSLISLPLGYPSLSGKFDRLLFSLYKKAYKTMVPGQQMVQFADFGGVDLKRDTDPTLRQPLKFLSVEGDRVVHAEVDIRADFLEAIGIDPTGDISTINEELRRVMGYRIPQQGKSSLLIMKIRRVLPKSHDGVIRVPPGITTQMGSDFDIDKMFILFPEIETVPDTKAEVIYSAVFFDVDTVTSKYEQVHENLYSHHSTIEFKPKSIEGLPIGENRAIKVVGRLTTDRVDVLLVENPLSKNKFPHITLSTAEGVKPFESNKALEENQDKIVPLDDTLEGVVGFFDSNRVEQTEIETVPTAKAAKGSPQDKLINFLQNYGFEVRASENLIINLAQKTISLDTDSIEQVAKAMSEPLAEMLSYSDYFYIIEKQVRNTEKFKQRLLDLEEKYGKGKKRNLYRQAAKDIFKELLESGFSEKLAKELDVSPSLLQKIKQFIQDIIDSLKGADYGIIKEQIDTIVENTFKGEDFIRLTKKEGYKQVEFQQAFDENSIAKDIMTRIGTDPRIILTGSIAYATQGTVYRKIETVVHDLDFVNLGTREDAKELITTNYPEAVEAYAFETPGYTTDTYLVPPRGLRITDLTRRPAGLKIIGFNIRNANNEIVGTYQLDYKMSPMGTVINETEIKTGVEAMFVDFFTNSKIGNKNPITHPFVGSDGVTYNVKLAEYSVPFEAKLDFSRFKDIWDYNRFIPIRQPKVRKVQVPYSELNEDLTGVKELSDAQLNNILFDTFEAIASNINHLDETFSPLDGEDLSEARNDSPYKVEDQNIFSTVDSVQSTINNMLSHRLRGIWANAVLGRNVVMGSQVNSDLLIGQTLQFIDREGSYKSDRLRTTSLFKDVTGTTRPTDYFMSLHLGAAVDSVKDPLQYAINDTTVTAKIATYLYARGLTPAQVSVYLNHPAIRRLTDLARANDESITKVLKREHFKELYRRSAGQDMYVLDFEKMRADIAAAVEGKYDSSKDPSHTDLIKTFSDIVRESNDLYNLFSAVTVFTIDKSGTLPQNLAMFDNVDNYLTKASEGSIYGGKQLITAILEGDAYKYSASVWKGIQTSLQVASDAGFVANQPGYQQFRKALMDIGKGNPYREDVQKVMLNAVNHHLVTKPGSPLFEQGYMDKTLVESLFLSEDEEGSISYELNRIKNILSKRGQYNMLLESLEEVSYTFPNEKKMNYLTYNNRKQRDVGEQNAIIAGWEELYFNDSGTLKGEEIAYAKQFAQHLLTNAIVTTGFAPGARSMMNVLPPRILEDIGVSEHYTQEIEQLQLGRTELTTEFIDNFMLHYGGYKYGNETILQQYNSKTLGVVKLKDATANVETVKWGKDTPPPTGYILIKGVKGMVEVTEEQRGADKFVTFKLLPRRSMKGRLYEHNLRTEEGTVFDGSLIFEERKLLQLKNSGKNPSPATGIAGENNKGASQEDLDTLTAEYTDDTDGLRAAPPTGKPTGNEVKPPTDEDENNAPESSTQWQSLIDFSMTESPRGVQAKIARLTDAFATAGVEIKFVLASLPKGTKGMVEGNIVTIDPAQMRADTAYHEVGHILVDMLPEEDVRQYIAQVEKTRPDIADMVRDKYANEGLTEFEMGKEILVTAIGIEGAKIERKNPSKLQIIINRILRAIGKLFGITPDAAAVLAEKMFAGDIKSMVLTKQLNPRIRLQKTLEEKIDDIFVEGYQNLERQIRELKFKPEGLRTKAEILKIKQLQATLANISENKASIDGFLTFSEYVHEQAEIMKIAFDELRQMKDNPVKKEDALRLLNKIDAMQHTMSTFYNHKDRGRSLIDQLKDVVNMAITKEEDPSKRLLLSEQVQRNLDISIIELGRMQEEYIDLVAPLVADSYASYFDSGINEKLDEIIAAVRKTRDTSGMSRDLDYQSLKKKKAAIEQEARNKGLDPEEAFVDAVLELKIRKLQAKKLNRDNIISELKNAHADKHAFSLWLDPMVYSSEANLQMFSLTLNESNFNTNKQSIPLINRAAEEFALYKEYAGISDVNKSQFYAPFITKVTTRVGGKELVQLSLAQPYDIDKFYKTMFSFLDDLAIRTNRPEYDPTDIKSKEEYEKWVTSNKGRQYYQEKGLWFARNTVPVKDAAKRLKEMQKERAELIEQKEAARIEGIPQKEALLQEYINDLTNTIRNSYNSVTKQFMGPLAMPKAYDEKGGRLYASEQYEKIQATPELKRFYDFLMDTYKEKQVPYGDNNPQFMNRWDNFSYILPSVRQSNIEAIGRLGLKGVITELKDSVLLTETDQELYGAALDQEGKAAKFLPRYYTNPVGENEVTRDILSSILMYSHRSNQYVERAKLVGLVNAMSNLHQKREKLQKDETGAKLLNREALAFMKQYRDRVIDPTASVPDNSTNTYNHLIQFIDTAFYGITKQKLEAKIAGIDPTKFVNTMNSLAAFGSLSFNFLQIGNQAILDNLMIREEAIAGEFFSSADVRWGKKEFVLQGAGIKDIGAFAPKTKLGKTMLYFDALLDATDSLGKDASDNKFLKSIQMGNLLALQGAVEYETAAVRMLAAMKALEGTFVDKNGKVIMNEKGEPANLWDLMVETKEGIELDPRVDKAKSKFDEARFNAKLRGLYKRTNQVKGSHDASTLSRTPWGAFLMLFKNYLIPGWRKRWGHGDIYHIDLELDTVSRGMYLSAAQFVKRVAKNPSGYRDLWENMSDVDKRNVKRTFTELGIVLFTYMSFAALQGILDDDDDDNYTAAYFAYQSRRLQTELAAFVNPGEALRMFVAPMAAANRMEKYWDLLTHTIFSELPYDARLLIGFEPSESLTKDVIYQRDTYWGEKGDRKIWGKIGKVTPGIYGFSTLDAETVEQKIRFFE